MGHNDFDAGNIHFNGHWKGWALKIKTFLGPERATSKASAQKSQDFSGSTPSNGPSNGFARNKIIKSKRHIKNRYSSNFMYMSFLILYSIF